jgi:hypothetical protein
VPLPFAPQTILYDGIPRFEAGGQFTGLALTGPVQRGDLGVGGHFVYNFNEFLSFEANVNAFKIGTTATRSLHATEAFFGPRLGCTLPGVGLYVKLLPEFIRYFPNHLYVRFDAGSTIVNYGSGSVIDPVSGQPFHLGTHGNPTLSLGFGAHF